MSAYKVSIQGRLAVNIFHSQNNAENTPVLLLDKAYYSGRGVRAIIGHGRVTYLGTIARVASVSEIIARDVSNRLHSIE